MSDLAIATTIKARRLTQAAAAGSCDIDQPQISELVGGELYGFSIDQLFRFLTALGQDVEIVAHDHRREGATARAS